MREIYSVIALFLIVQLLGLSVGAIMSSPANSENFSDLNVSPTKDSGNTFNSIYFLVVVILGAVFLILLIKFYKGVFAFKALETFIIFFASFIVFYSFLYQFAEPLSSISPYLGLAELWALIFAFALAALKYRIPALKNVTAVIASAGVGAIFGFSLDLLPAVLFIIGLSIYDVIAVFYTKHMLTMAREMGKRNMSFSVSVESIHKRKATLEEEKAMREKDLKAPKNAKAPLEGKRTPAEPDRYKFIEEKRHLELGTGDMAIPLMLSVSALRFGGLGLALAATLGACIGLYFTLEYVFRNKTFLPALPPISTGALAMLALVWLIKSIA